MPFALSCSINCRGFSLSISQEKGIISFSFFFKYLVENSMFINTEEKSSPIPICKNLLINLINYLLLLLELKYHIQFLREEKPLSITVQLNESSGLGQFKFSNSGNT